MAWKIGLIFLLALTAGISFGKDEKCKNPKKDRPKIDMLKVPQNISRLADLVTLKGTRRLWNRFNFSTCLDGESYHFFDSEVKFAYDLIPLLKNLKSIANGEEIGRLAYENCGYVTENYDLMEQARRNIYEITKRSPIDDEKLKKYLNDIKEKLIYNFQDIDKNFLIIQKLANSKYEAQLAEVEKTYREKVKNIKQAARKYFKEVRKCLKRLNTKV